MDNFFAMNGYGEYIWTAYGAVAFILGGLAFHLYNRARCIENKLAQLESDETKA
ncbi:MAG: heme exporter protein CcmD [Alphaproteobacteria bacterium]|nr:MAG: heme exporter protein CcmD [Alphaproteobacteria bacterium]